MALGADSLADRANSVSVGNSTLKRQITNVAAGTDATDAVNKAQLDALAGSVDDASHYFDVNSTLADASASGSNALAAGPRARAEAKDSIAIGNGATTLVDTVSKDKLGRSIAMGNEAKADREYAMAFGYKAHANGDSSIALGAETWARGYDSIALGTRAGTGADWSTALGADSRANGTSSLALGSKAQATATNSVALGAGSLANRTNSVSVGNSTLKRQITNVAAGTDATDAVNLSQLQSVTAAATADAVQYDDAGKASVTFQGAAGTTLGNVADGEVSADSLEAVNGRQLHATNQAVDTLRDDALLWDSALGAYSARRGGSASKISDVAKGDVNATSTDAVNGAQLFEVDQQVGALDGRVTTLEGTLGGMASGGGIKYFHSNSSQADSVASGSDSLAAGPAAVASGAQSTAVGNQASASGSSSAALGNQASASGNASTAIGSQASASADNAVALGAGSVADRANSVSVGSTGHERQITNVADGTEKTDAVNKGQLDSVAQNAKQYTDDTVTALNGDVQAMDGRVTATEQNVGQLNEGQAGMFRTHSSAAKPVASGSNAVAGGSAAVASAANSTAIGHGAQATAQHATALGHGARASANNAVALGANSVADRADSVSVGSAGAERQITHVAAGTQASDAVNLGQLNKGLDDVASSAYDYTKSVYNTLRRDIHELDDELSAGIAGAMAMAALPQSNIPGAAMSSAGLANFRGKSALAIGVSKASQDGKWITKLQGSATSEGEAGVSMGVGYHW
ncbi:Coiled stalk of trimeric autotransporter adhesin [compost metagenome]